MTISCFFIHVVIVSLYKNWSTALISAEVIGENKPKATKLNTKTDSIFCCGNLVEGIVNPLHEDNSMFFVVYIRPLCHGLHPCKLVLWIRSNRYKSDSSDIVEQMCLWSPFSLTHSPWTTSVNPLVFCGVIYTWYTTWYVSWNGDGVLFFSVQCFFNGSPLYVVSRMIVSMHMMQA